MQPRGQRLLNTPRIEAIPAWLARARGNATARTLARAQWLLRRKSDGRFLAAVAGNAVDALDAATMRADTGIGEALRAIASDRGQALALDPAAPLYRALDIPTDYGAAHGLLPVDEPAELALAGLDRYRRPLWLLEPAAHAWRRLRAAALAQDVLLDAISGYRSHAYQLGIFQRKLARGQDIARILTVNTPPGFSEHHSGRAIDIGTPGQPPAEESFETTAAFSWLIQNAARFGFTLSYPRNNPHGIVYEPWHFCWHPVVASR